MSESITRIVQRKYGEVASQGLSSQQQGVRSVAQAFGYSDEELASIPAEANLGLSCGNPTAMASLQPGEVVVDLGCGGGLDVFLAAQRVGPEGMAIGIDMTPQMIELALVNARKLGNGTPVPNVAFHLAHIDQIPLSDQTVDCVISNCVINLAPDKPAVFREISRILKPGGRLAVSDIALKRPLPAELAADIGALVGCIAGAIPLDQYQAGLLAAGFTDVALVDTGADLNAYAQVENQAGCCSPVMDTGPAGLPLVESCCSSPPPATDEAGTDEAGTDEAAPLHRRLADLLAKYDVNHYAASVKVFALKPHGA